MNKASPVDLRKAMETATALMKAGVLFVPIPVVDGATDHAELIFKLEKRLELMVERAEGEEVK